MPNLISLTEARSNLSKIVNEVTSKRKPYILIRGSKPQVAIIAYQDYQKEQSWQEETEELMRVGREKFREYLKRNKIKIPKNEEEVYELIDKVLGRH